MNETIYNNLKISLGKEFNKHLKGGSNPYQHTYVPNPEQNIRIDYPGFKHGVEKKWDYRVMLNGTPLIHLNFVKDLHEKTAKSPWSCFLYRELLVDIMNNGFEIDYSRYQALELMISNHNRQMGFSKWLTVKEMALALTYVFLQEDLNDSRGRLGLFCRFIETIIANDPHINWHQPFAVIEERTQNLGKVDLYPQLLSRGLYDTKLSSQYFTNGLHQTIATKVME